ncbi:Transcriptional regulator TetR [Anopheles sinensis]|uniref:Transcriptional regulator TetR n=1 Tax=Anopheles sinensis TaxID=74873 RepID=A0A084VNQ9_ANOSI|nr:Transcriptional regulator TetR [Anopheles sinensis]
MRLINRTTSIDTSEPALRRTLATTTGCCPGYRLQSPVLQPYEPYLHDLFDCPNMPLLMPAIRSPATPDNGGEAFKT